MLNIYHTKRLTLTEMQWRLLSKLVAQQGFSRLHSRLDEAEILAITSHHPNNSTRLNRVSQKASVAE